MCGKQRALSPLDLEVWQRKELRADFADVWQGKELARKNAGRAETVEGPNLESIQAAPRGRTGWSAALRERRSV